GPTDVGGCHAGSIEAIVGIAADRAADLFSGSDQVGLDATITGWPATRKVAHAKSVRIRTVSRSDGDDMLGIAWIGDRAKHEIAEPKLLFVPTAIAGGSHDNHARSRQSIAGDAYRRRAAAIIPHVVRDRKAYVDSVNYWTGSDRTLVDVLHVFNS